VVVTSDQSIVAVGRPHIGSEITTYDGFASGSTGAYTPMLFKDAFGGTYDTALYVQNLSGSSADVMITFYDASGALSCALPDTIPALASHGYWLPSVGCLGTSWTGSAVISATQNVAVIARPHLGGQVASYDGFPGGSTGMKAPMLFKNAFGGSYDSALYVQNLNNSITANVTLKFYDTAGVLSCVRNETIGPLAILSYWLPGLTC